MPQIAEIRRLVHIPAFPHNAVRKGVKEKAARVVPYPLYECGERKAAEIPGVVQFREKAHFSDFQIVRGQKAVPWENLSYRL